MRPLAIGCIVAVAGAPVETIKVFGHLIPDTDAICAALGYAWELQERGISARAYRLGELNSETSYVLSALKIETPPLLERLSVGTRVAVVDTNNPQELPEGINRADIHSVSCVKSTFGWVVGPVERVLT